MKIFDLSEQQVLINQAVERIAQNAYTGDEHRSYLETKVGYSPKVWRILGESGLFALSFSPRNNGIRDSIKDLTVFMQAIGKAVFVEPILSSPVIGGIMLDALGSAEQVENHAQNIISGHEQLALAHAEKDARFHLNYIQTKFKKKGDAYALSGKKIFVVGLSPAGKFIVSAKASTQDGQKDIRFFLVDANSHGIFKQPYRLTDGSYACDLDLRDVPGEIMSGSYSDFISAISCVKVAACAESIGIMERLFDDTLEYVKTREQFGRPLGKFQVIQHRLADQYGALELSRSHLERMIASDPSSKEGQNQIAGSRAFISKAALDLSEEAVQLHGGMGITDELIIGRGLKRLLVLASLFGDSNYELNRFC